MLGEAMHSFFFGAPAILAVVAGLSMQSRVARAILVVGGAAFTVVIWAGLAGMLACDGYLFTGFSNCIGGPGTDTALAALHPVLRAAAMAYILAGPPLAALAYGLEWLHRRAATA